MRSADRFEKGAAGEEETALALGELPAEDWAVFHDVRWPDRKLANIDHVVVGPPGVFVVDTKNWSGTISLRDGVLRSSGYRRDNTVANVAEAALAVARLVTDVPPHAVVPLLCFVNQRPLAGWAHDVAVCTTANVVDMLRSRPPVLSREERLRATTRLGAHLVKVIERQPAVVRVIPSDRLARRRSVRPHPAVPRIRARRRRGGLMGVLAAAALAIGCFAVSGTDVVSRVGQLLVR